MLRVLLQDYSHSWFKMLSCWLMSMQGFWTENMTKNSGISKPPPDHANHFWYACKCICLGRMKNRKALSLRSAKQQYRWLMQTGPDHKRLGRTVITTSLLHGINLNLAAWCKCALNTEKRAPKLSAAPACGIVFKAKKLYVICEMAFLKQKSRI